MKTILGGLLGVLLFHSPIAGPGRCDEAKEKEKPTAKGVPPLPEAVRAAWQRAGYQVGWLGVGPDGILAFRARAEEGKAGEVPAFRWSKWQAGVLAKLPQPTRAFGLDLGESGVDDAGLKELAGLKQLRTLVLIHSKVTEAGVKKLQKALPSLDIVH